MDLDLDPVCGEAGQFSREDERVGGLIQVHRRHPRANAPAGLLAVTAAEDLIEQLVHLALKGREMLHRRPWNKCHGDVLLLYVTGTARYALVVTVASIYIIHACIIVKSYGGEYITRRRHRLWMPIAWDARMPHAGVGTCLLMGQRWESQVGDGDAQAPDVLGRGRAVYGGLVSRGAPGIKTLPPGHTTSRGGVYNTRRLETHPHGALRSREASPSQSSSQQGCCHPDRPTRSRGSSDPPVEHIVSCPHLLSRGSPHASRVF